MKCFIVALALIAIVAAKPSPDFRSPKSAKQSKPPAVDAESVDNDGYNYDKPTGQKFELPNEDDDDDDKSAPAQEYGAPLKEYGAPADQYGAPTTEDDDETTTEVPESSDAKAQQGAFYILLPDSRLQRLVYNVQSDPQNQRYTSSVQTTGYQQLSQPLVIYTPQFYQAV